MQKRTLTLALASLGVVGLAASHEASAQITTAASGNSDLVFVVVDPNTGETYYNNTGISALTGSSAAAALAAGGTFSDSSWTTFKTDTAGDAASLLYAVVGGGGATGASNPLGVDSYDSTVGGKGIIPGAFTNSALASFSLIDGNLITPINALNGTSQQTGVGYLVKSSSTIPSPQYTQASGLWNWNGNASFYTPATVGTENDFYNFTHTAGAGAGGNVTPTLLGDFNLSLGNSSWSFSPPAAVPLPAAVWLLGSGLLGLMGISRRRSAG